MSVDRLRQRLQLAEDALRTLDELAFLANPTRIERDAAIQRFEYTVEAIWKAAQRVLSAQYGIELASPKTVVRACAQNGLLDDGAARAAMQAIDDRNLTAHAYSTGCRDPRAPGGNLPAPGGACPPAARLARGAARGGGRPAAALTVIGSAHPRDETVTPPRLSPG